MNRHRLRPSVPGLLACLLAAACTGAPSPRTVAPDAAPLRLRAPLARDLSPADARWVEETMARMSLRQKVGQLLVPRIPGGLMSLDSDEYDRLRHWVEDLEIGGVIITTGAPATVAVKLNTLQRLAAVPLLVTADFEHGTGQILNGGVLMPGGNEYGGGTRFPPAMGIGASGDENIAYQLGRVTAIEARAAGIHVVFAPVADVNNNPDNPIINTRSYGADPAMVGRFVAAHVRGLQDHGVIATPKHFPGHGDTGTDSHIELPFIYTDRARVDSVELVPFRAALAAGAAAVMTAHIAFPAVAGDSVPATLNARILKPLLREQMAFDDLVFTDAMDMGAIVRIYGQSVAPVMAINAGADIWLQLLPNAVEPVLDSMVVAVRRGDVTEARLNESVRRMLTAKVRLGLHRNRFVDLERMAAALGGRTHMLAATEAAQSSITAVRNRTNVLPLQRQRVLSIIYSDDNDPLVGRAFHRVLANRLAALRTATLNENSDAAQLNALRQLADSADVVLFSPFIRVTAGKLDLAVAPRIAAFVNELQQRRPVVVTTFGNPYVLRQFPDIDTYVIAWGHWEPLQTAAARALAGVHPITGRLPAPIPPYHVIGDGVTVNAARAER